MLKKKGFDGIITFYISRSIADKSHDNLTRSLSGTTFKEF